MITIGLVFTQTLQPTWRMKPDFTVVDNTIEADISDGRTDLIARFNVYIPNSVARYSAPGNSCFGITYSKVKDKEKALGSKSNQVMLGQDFLKKYWLKIDPSTFHITCLDRAGQSTQGWTKYEGQPEFDFLCWTTRIKGPDVQYGTGGLYSPLTFVAVGPHVEEPTAGVSLFGNSQILVTESGVFYKRASTTSKLEQLAVFLSYRMRIPVFVKESRIFFSNSWIVAFRQKPSQIIKIDDTKIDENLTQQQITSLATNGEKLTSLRNGKETEMDIFDFESDQSKK